MKHVLGVDGGGTKTTARLLAVGADGRFCVLGSGHAAGSNPLSVGWDAAQAAISQAIQQAVHQAGQTAGLAVDAAALAVAGCASPAARDRLNAWAESERFAGLVRVVPDTESLLAEVPAGGSAIGLIAGTGSSALVRRPDGSTEMAGGWGYLIDDAGSGYSLGRDALRAVTSQWDATRTAGPLGEALMRAAAVDSPPGFKGALYGATDPRAWAARLAPTVLALAQSDEPTARVVVETNAAALADLADLASTAHARIEGDRPTVLLAGGLLTGAAYYRALVVEGLLRRGWRREQIAFAPDAACACGRLAAALV